MICIQVSPDDGSFSSHKSTLSHNPATRTFTLNEQPLQLKTPIGIQNFQSHTCVFLSPWCIVAIHPSNLRRLQEILTRDGISSVKVPEKATQMLASEEAVGRQGCVVHCGSFNDRHDCFIVLEGGEIVVKNDSNQVLHGCRATEAQFDDKQSKFGLGERQYFYFWKQLEYIQAKNKILSSISVEAQPQIVSYGQNVQDIQKQRQIDSVNQIPSQIPNNIIQQFSQSEMQEQSRSDVEEKGESKDSQMIPGKKRIKKPRKEMEKTSKKMMGSQIMNQKTTKKQKPQQEQEPQGSIHPSQSQMNMQQSQSVQPQAQSNQHMDLLTSVIKMALQNYTTSQYRVQLCGLNGCDVIDVRSMEDKQVMYYHKFNQNGTVAESQELTQLKYTDEDGQEHKVKATKLVFDAKVNGVFFNDTERPYIHAYLLKDKVIESYEMKKLVPDMVSNGQGQILLLHHNEIIQFSTTVDSAAKCLAKYKTVHNLDKISNVFGGNYYAVVDIHGTVRCYDMKSRYKKAICRIYMPAGITSVQVSGEGEYILCRYGHKAIILSGLDKNNSSIFKIRGRKQDRQQSRNLVKGFENLSHIQFLPGSKDEGDMIAADDTNPCRLVVKNLQAATKETAIPLSESLTDLQYLACNEGWIIYGRNGKYYRQKYVGQ